MVSVRRRYKMNGGESDSEPLVMQSFLTANDYDGDGEIIQYETPRRRLNNKWTWKQKLVLVVLIGSLLAVFATLLLTLALPTASKHPPADNGVCTSPDCVRTAAEILNSVDPTIDPCEDFFHFVCNNFIQDNPIPDDRASFSTFTMIDINNSKKLRRLLEVPAKANSDEAVDKARRAYAACMDLDKVEELGKMPILSLLQPIKSWVAGKMRLENLLVRLIESGTGTFLRLDVGGDFKDSSVNTLYLEQGGLGLPDPKYYTENSKAVAAYQELLSRFLVMAEVITGNGLSEAKMVLDFESRLANITVPNDELRDPKETYNPHSVEELQSLFGSTSSFDFKVFFSALGLAKPVDKVIVTTPKFFRGLGSVLTATPRPVLELYLSAHVLSAYARTMPKEYRDEYDKYNRVLTGAKSDVEQWQRCVWRVSSDLGMAIGRLFVDHIFGSNAKNVAESMITEVLKAFEGNMDTLSWMHSETIGRAKQKAGMLVRKIAFSPKIVNDTALAEEYDGLDVENDAYLLNLYRTHVHKKRKELKEFREPVDKSRWEMDPQTVNAYYEATKNEIVFPAGILQPPFFSPAYPLSMNFGGIGSVVGHEISHGFDDEGRQYDGNGILADWWAPEQVQKFTELSECFVRQYGHFTVEDAIGTSHNVNGKLTLGENMADNGGLVAAFKGYQQWLADNGPELPLPGLQYTHEQLFFINFARVWCNNMRPESALRLVLTDPHSPAKYRVFGSLMNTPEFAAAFKCTEGSKYNPGKRQRCKVW